MRNHAGSIHRFFAILTILSFTFTKAVPAYALRAEQSPKSRAGLEEALGGVAVRPAGAIDLDRLPPEVALRYLAWATSRSSPAAAARF